MTFIEKLSVTMMVAALLFGLFYLDARIDRQCTPPAVKIRASV